ncbi:hypothetical protein CJ030_MR5G001856 [Morella rubra]|uniref:Uncharacterized protein n=1 Tax=Morella rubra TaxID=262757 RepID=A0A6A1VJG2_9ROSI|nr:hypothetical protein CJ030_MR5G001856 [Morella rubra]
MSAVNKFISSTSKGQDGALTRRFACRAVVAAEEAARALTNNQTEQIRGTSRDGKACSASSLGGLAICESRQPCRGYCEDRSTASLGAVDKLAKEVQELRDDQEKLRTSFEGECTITFLCNKAVVAHMKGVNELLEENKKTLDDFKTVADP